MATYWFGVKTLFRTRAVGRPEATDHAFDPKIDRVEERVVLFRARSSDAAIARAQTEAKRYAETVHWSPYGQKVVTEFLGACEAFWLFDPPASGIEVFSSMVLVRRSDSRAQLIDRWFGSMRKTADKRRLKFHDRELSGVVGRGSVWRPAKAKRPKAKSRARPRSTRA